MKHVNKTAISLTCFALALTGCAAQPAKIETVTVTKIVTPDVPPALLACMHAPAVPVMTMQSQAAALLVREYIAGQDCRLHLSAVRQALGVKP